jgi:sugar lactone lactonase YvrE
MRRSGPSWLVVLLLGLAACGGPTPPTGALSIAITGLPPDAVASVEVSGPSGFAETVTATRVLSGLAPGTYMVTGATVDDGHPVVPAVYDPTVATPSLDVTADEVAVAAVTYTWRTPTGRLWLSRMGADGEVLKGLEAGQLTADGAPQAAVGIDYEPGTWNGIAFDVAGNAWTARYNPQSTIARFRAADLANSAARVPDVVLTSVAPTILTGPVGLAFDASGALWVSGFASDTIVKYAAEQLAGSGAPSPQVVLTSAAGSLDAPAGIAFDADGNLWVANSGNDSVVAFTPAQLAASGSPSPAVALTSSTGGLHYPYGLAFDAAGSLWVAPVFSGAVLRYGAAQLVASGTPTPAATVTGFAAPKALAFDHAGDLWVHGNLTAGSFIVRIADPAALTLASEVVIATAIEIDFLTDAGFPTFFPTPPGLPIHTP